MESEKNILGNRLEACSLSPATGFKRNGHCQHSKQDFGLHGVCSEVTEEFLNFTRDRGNDLSSPNELHGFPGLKSGDRWCLCASRWKEALENGVAPPVVLSATNEAVLKYISLDDLIKHACEFLVPGHRAAN
jgi:uncharacterized protein (DUF2237 family)